MKCPIYSKVLTEETMEKGVFESSHLHKVYFDKGLEQSLADILREEHNTNILVATNTSLAESPAIQKIKELTNERNVFFCNGLRAHSPRNDVIKISKMIKENDIGLIIGLGGGSVCDTLKVANLGASNNFSKTEDIDKLRGTTKFSVPKAKLVALPTTLSAGEYTCFAGITNEEVPAKEVFYNKSFPPAAVVLDPWLTLDTPDRLFFSTGVRALDHAVETWCAPKVAPTHAAMALQGFRILMHSLKHAKHDTKSYNSRHECQIAAWLSIQGVAGGLDLGASHGIGHILGGSAGMPHGETSCVMLPHVLDFNLPATQAKQNELNSQIEQSGGYLSKAIKNLVIQLELPTRLQDCNIPKDSLPDLAKECLSDKWLETNPIPLRDAKKIQNILEKAW